MRNRYIRDMTNLCPVRYLKNTLPGDVRFPI